MESISRVVANRARRTRRSNEENASPSSRKEKKKTGKSLDGRAERAAGVADGEIEGTEKDDAVQWVPTADNLRASESLHNRRCTLLDVPVTVLLKLELLFCLALPPRHGRTVGSRALRRMHSVAHLWRSIPFSKYLQPMLAHNFPLDRCDVDTVAASPLAGALDTIHGNDRKCSLLKASCPVWVT